MDRAAQAEELQPGAVIFLKIVLFFLRDRQIPLFGKAAVQLRKAVLFGKEEFREELVEILEADEFFRLHRAGGDPSAFRFLPFFGFRQRELRVVRCKCIPVHKTLLYLYVTREKFIPVVFCCPGWSLSG